MTFAERATLLNAQAELEALRAEGRGMVWANEVCVQEGRPIVFNQADFNELAARFRETKVRIEDAVEMARIPRMSSPDEIEMMISDCEKRESKLSDWERGFIDDIGIRLGRGNSLTPKQDDRLSEIWERVTDG